MELNKCSNNHLSYIRIQFSEREDAIEDTEEVYLYISLGKPTCEKV